MIIDKNKIDEFFEVEVTPKEFAKKTRRFIHEVVQMTMIVDENNYIPNKQWLQNGFNVLHNLCELLDPNLQEDTDISNT